MSFGVEKVGNYDVRKMDNGKYSVAVNNGNIGACVTDEAGVQKIRDKYAPDKDKVDISNNQKPKMSEQEARSLIAMALMPGGFLAVALDPQKFEEAKKAMEYYNKQ